MTKDVLYSRLIRAYNRHQCMDTTCASYVDAVIKLVKEYIDSHQMPIDKEN